MPPEPVTIAEIAAAQRALNARRFTATLSILTLISAPATVVLGGNLPTALLLVVTGAGQALSYWLVRAGKPNGGTLLCGAALLAEHVGVVAIDGILGPVPYIVPIVILLAAASAEARWLPAALVASMLALGIEGYLSPWQHSDHVAIFTAGLFTVIVFVVSTLHVRGTEHAFALAQKRDEERARAAAQARESDERYRLISENIDDLVALVDREGRALYLSPSHERLFGIDVAQCLGRRVEEFIVIENAAEGAQVFADTLSRGEGQLELRVRGRGGELRILDLAARRIVADGEALIASFSRDVTERKRMEARLLASERLEALGRLAGGVAHDFNNLLTVIGGAAELARSTLPEDHPAAEEIEAVLDAAQSATKVTRQLLTFSRKQVVVRAPLDLATALTAEQEILQRMVGRNVRVRYDFEAGLPPVSMPAAHFDQLVMNLAVNARDAMPGGGELTLGLRRRALAAGEIETLPPGPYVELTVADQGTGVPEDVLPHIFDPFFSTKGEAGTGLGLATCLSIASQAGGWIGVETTRGKGTTFRVLFPVSVAAPAQPVHAPRPTELKRVLVVDDERSVREMTARLLQSAGLEVHTASTLEEARRILEDHGVELDALLTDVVLSGERGTDLLEDCRRERPSARIVVMSGYTPDPNAAEVLAAHGARFLPKPFSLEQLLGAVHGTS